MTNVSVKHKRVKKTMLQFFVFGLVGVLNTIVDLVVYWVFLQLSVTYIAANVLGYGAGMLNSYIWNNKITFRKLNHIPNQVEQTNSQVERTPGHVELSSKGKLLRFIVWNVFTMLLSSACIVLFVELIHWSEMLSKIMTTVIIVAVQFIGMKKWVFRN